MKRSARVVACGAKIPLHVTTWQKFKVAEDEPTTEEERTLYQAEDNMKRSASVVACGAKKQHKSRRMCAMDPKSWTIK